MASIQKRKIIGKPGKDGYKRSGIVYDVYYYFYDRKSETTRRTSKKGFVTEKGAMDYANKIEHEMAIGKFIPETKMKVSELMNEWLESVKPTIAYNTHRGYESNIRLHIIPGIGRCSLSKLNLSHVQRLYNSLGKEGKGLSPASVKYVHRNLSSALDYAVMRKLLAYNASKGAKLPKLIKVEKTIYDAKEIINLINCASHPETKCVIALAGLMGLRRAEILGLSFDRDIDMDDKSIQIRKQVIRTKKGYEFTEPKSQKSKRKLFMPSVVYSLVKEQRKRQLVLIKDNGIEFNKHRLLFCNKSGSNFSFEGLTLRLKNALKESGTKILTLHELRHSFGSMLILSDVNIKVVSDLLGHSSIAITADTYMHVIDSKKKEAANSIDSVIKRASNNK